MSEWHKIFRNGPVLTHSPEEMRELGRQIGKILMPGEILGVVGGPAAGNDLKFRPQFSEVWLMKSVFGEDKIEGQRRKNR